MNKQYQHMIVILQLMLLGFLGMKISAQNQVVISIMVPPPYAPHLSYYIDDPSRILITLVNNTGSSQELFLQGTFTSDDEGIVIRTMDGFQPPMSLHLDPYETYQANIMDLQDIFPINNLSYTGITPDELVLNQGVPEGNYVFCFQAFDFETLQPLSAYTCSNIFPIQYVDPPLIITPVCADSILALPAQNLVVSWTFPIGAMPGNVEYRLQLVEMLPKDRDPNDAFQSAAYPGFLDEITTINSYVIGPADPELIPGRNYAFRVQALDIDNQIVFNNNGFSEVCWFHYKEEGFTPANFDFELDEDLSDLIHDFELIPNTVINGKLLYNLHSNATIAAVGGAVSAVDGNQQNPPEEYTDAGEPGLIDYGELMNFSLLNGGNINLNNISYDGGGFNMIDPGSLLLNPPYGSGYINGEVVSTGNAEPLRNTYIKLVARYNIAGNDGYFDTRTQPWAGYRYFDISGNEISYEKVMNTVNKTLDVAITDDQGNFSFDFRSDFFTGPFYVVSDMPDPFMQETYVGVISLRIELLNLKFCSPDIDIFARQGDFLELPAQVALIKDFDLHLQVISDFDVYQGNPDDSTIYMGFDIHPKVIPGGQPIPGAIVRVFRDMQELDNEHPAILLAEGQQLGSTTENQHGSFKDVFLGNADNNGVITIESIVKHWAVTDGENQSPYYFSISTRPDNIDEEYESTFYNFDSFFGDITGLRLNVDAGGTTLLDDDAAWSGLAPVVYNHFYVPPQSATDRKVYLNALKPEIKGRIMVQSNLENIGLGNVQVNLFTQENYENDLETIETDGANANLKYIDKYQYADLTYTNESGFFRFPDLTVFEDEYGSARGPYRRFQSIHAIYESFTWPPLEEMPLNLKYGELYFKEFQLETKRILKGKVQDENSQAVSSYIRVLENNPYVKTEPRYEYDENGQIYIDREIFEVPVAVSNNYIEILPLSSQYFPDTVFIQQVPSNPNEWVTFSVYKKLHRLKLQLKNEVTNGIISGASVVVGDTLAHGITDEYGYVELIFPSPGEQFLIKVEATDFTPTQISYTIPVKDTWQYEILKLEPALALKGIITEKNSNNPIEDAWVYIRLQTTDGHTVYLEDRTDAAGEYRITGFPMSMGEAEIHAVKEGSDPSYIGVTETFAIEAFAYPEPSYDLQLFKIVNMDFSDIWGFPVCIESMFSKPGLGTFISGFFYNLPHIVDMEASNEDTKVYFKSLYIDPSPSDKKIHPLEDHIVTETYYIPVRISGGFEGRFKKPAPFMFPKKLELEQNGDYGSMKAALKIDLASFKFAYDFDGDFYVGDDTLQPDLAVFRSVNPSFPFFIKRKYIFDLDDSNQPQAIHDFRVLGFNADADFESAYYEDDAIHVKPVLHTDIPMGDNDPALDLKIRAGEILVTREEIDLIPFSNNLLSFAMEEWKVESTAGWEFDKTRDALFVPRALILTGLGVDASIKGLLIRPTSLTEGEIDLENGLSLGGIAELSLAQGLEPRFNFDAGVGHYRISLVGSTQGPAAWMDDLPATNDRLEFTSLGMLSDNSSVLSLGKQMLFHNILDIFVDQMMTGNGFFKLAGTPDLDIPGFIPTMATMTYTKPSGSLVAKLEPISGTVDCNANMVFKLDQLPQSQMLSHNTYSANGVFYIKPEAGMQGDDLTMKGFLTKTHSLTRIEAIPQTIYMGKEPMQVIDGEIKVIGDAWNNLNFSCNTRSDGLDDENVLEFMVHGGIEANGNNIQVNNINTPLGNLVMSYIFPEKALIGDLVIKANLNMGFAAINSGVMHTRFDSHGYYLGFSGDISIGSDLYSGGFLLGSYDASLNNVAQPMLQNFETSKPDFSNLNGFYAIGQRNLINKSFDLLVISVGAKAGLGTFVNCDFASDKFQVGGYGYIKAKGGVDIYGCGYVGVNSNTYGNVVGTYQNGVLSLSQCNQVDLCVSACGLDGCIGVLNRVKITSNGQHDVILKLGGSCSDYND